MKNNKGFTLVEILGVVTIVGILSTVTLIAYYRYVDKAKQNRYDGLAKSAYRAAQSYAIENPSITSVTLANLVDSDLLENYSDPNSDGNCEGSIVTINNDSYDVKLCCSNYSYIYHYPSGTKTVATCN